MRRSLMVIAGMLLAGCANAQLCWQVVGGANFSQQIDHYEGQTVSNGIKTGFHVGGLMEWSRGRHFSIQTGLLYSMKGGEQEREI